MTAPKIKLMLEVGDSNHNGSLDVKTSLEVNGKTLTHPARDVERSGLLLALSTILGLLGLSAEDKQRVGLPATSVAALRTVLELGKPKPKAKPAPAPTKPSAA